MAKELDVRIVRDTVIYRLEDELRALIESLLPKERVLTREVRERGALYIYCLVIVIAERI